MKEQLLKRIIIDENICNGKPIVNGFRITVQTIIEFLLAGSSEDDILEEYPFLEREDIEACKYFTNKVMSNAYTISTTAA